MENKAIPTSTEEQIAKIIASADRRLSATVYSVLEETFNQAKEELRTIGQVDAAPPLEYFASMIHQRMYCSMCGADPETFEGGNPDIAYHIIRNSQNIAKHYWLADIEPYPSR